jgi:hypothetical protein
MRVVQRPTASNTDLPTPGLLGCPGPSGLRRPGIAHEQNGAGPIVVQLATWDEADRGFEYETFPRRR